MELFDEKAAARVLNVHPRTLRRWRDRGLIKYLLTPTGRIRYLSSELLDFRPVE